QAFSASSGNSFIILLPFQKAPKQHLICGYQPDASLELGINTAYI
ncbi:hypothetical protein WG8_4320, partial [Paenibacillus sp. Aloe-11]